MMRRSLIIAACCAASCSPSGEDNVSANSVGPPEPIVVTAASSGGTCAYLWNGEAVTAQGIGDRSVAAISEAIEGAGGIENMIDAEVVQLRLEGAPDVPYSCTGPALRELARAGLVDVVLMPAGASGQNAIFITDSPPDGPRAIVRLTKEGMSWDERAVDQPGLLERAQAEASSRPPVALVVAPAEDSGFLALHDALATIRQGGMEATLSGCAGSSGPIRESGPVC